MDTDRKRGREVGNSDKKRGGERRRDTDKGDTDRERV